MASLVTSVISVPKSSSPSSSSSSSSSSSNETRTRFRVISNCSFSSSSSSSSLQQVLQARPFSSSSYNPFLPPLLLSSSSSLYGRRGRRTGHERVVVTRAGLTTSNLIFAFVFPLSLVLVTVFTSIKIADKLDQDYLEELANNHALMEGKDEDESSPILTEEKPTLPSKRNRPKRVA